VALFREVQRGEAKIGSDSGQSLIACSSRDRSGRLKVIQKCFYEGHIEIVYAQRRWSLMQLRPSKPEQQPKSVTIGSDGVLTCLALPYEVIGEEYLEERRDL